MQHFAKVPFSTDRIASDVNNAIALGIFPKTFAEAIGEALDIMHTPGFCSNSIDTVCHGDPHFLNAKVDSENQLTLFDFDLCQAAPKSFDLGVFLQSRHQLQKDPIEIERDFAIFLEGYNQILPLSDDEIHSIPRYALSRSMWVFSQLHWAIPIVGFRRLRLSFSPMEKMLRRQIAVLRREN